jgi:AraC-like DNA-binding protein
LTIKFNLHESPQIQLTDKWEWVLSKAYHSLAVSELNQSSFEGSVQKTDIGDLEITEFKSNRHKLSRTTNHIINDENDCISFIMPTRSSCEVTQLGNYGVVGHGNAVLVRSSQPYTMVCQDDFKYLSFKFPYATIASRVSNFENIFGRSLKLNSPIQSFIHNTLRSLLDNDNIDDECNLLEQKVASYIIDLCAAIIENEYCVGATHYGSEHQQKLRKRIYAFIFDHLSDPDLSPAAIAGENKLSISYLHKLFKPEGVSVNRWILMKRLEQCHEKLLSPGYRHLSISRIAFDTGFNSLAHFSTRFRDHYGVSPRNLRVREAA